jgi:ABC-type sugar transport system permease subunit
MTDVQIFILLFWTLMSMILSLYIYEKRILEKLSVFGNAMFYLVFLPVTILFIVVVIIFHIGFIGQYIILNKDNRLSYRRFFKE